MKPGSFAIRYTERMPFMLLDTIGWQTTDSESYENDGMKRTDNGHVIFQYTLSGEGKVEIEGTTYSLQAGTGFIAKIPSSHRYYYSDQQGKPWEFIWLNAKGEDAVLMWDRILSRTGPILTLAADSISVLRFWELYSAMSIDRTSDAVELSSLLYRFVLSLLTPQAARSTREMPPPLINKAKEYIHANYNDPLTLQDIADHCEISRSYLCRLFQRKEAVSPLEYLRRKRIEAAVTLLRGTDTPVQEIGRLCGFDSPSYFGKVFRQHLGGTPLEYRTRKLDYPFDHLRIE